MDDPDAASLLPPCRGVTQSGIVVSRIWGGNLSFRPRRARNGHAVFSSLIVNARARERDALSATLR